MKSSLISAATRFAPGMVSGSRGKGLPRRKTRLSLLRQTFLTRQILSRSVWLKQAYRDSGYGMFGIIWGFGEPVFGELGELGENCSKLDVERKMDS